MQAFPGPGGKTQISPDGGTEPRWAKGGRELLYRNGRQMMSVDIEDGSELRASAPTMLFAGEFLRNQRYHDYDVTSDGERFIMIAPAPDAQKAHIEVVLNWFADLQARVPTGR